MNAIEYIVNNLGYNLPEWQKKFISELEKCEGPVYIKALPNSGRTYIQQLIERSKHV